MRSVGLEHERVNETRQQARDPEPGTREEEPP